MPSRTTNSDKAYPYPGAIIEIGEQGRAGNTEQEIYVDILVFLNTVVNYFLILSTAAIAGREKRTGRILAAAFLGGIYALILLVPQLSGPVLTITRIAAAMVMTRVAFPFLSWRAFLFQCGLLYLSGFLFGGLMVAIWFLAAPPNMIYANGVVYFHIPALVLVGCVLVCYGLVWLFTHGRHPREQMQAIAQVQITWNGKEVSLMGMVDTGNHLTDPFSGKPVVLCRYQSVKEILPDCLCRYFENEGTGRLEEAITQGIRLIPYEAVEKKGLLPAFAPENFTIRQNRRYQSVEQVMIAVADQTFFDSSCGILLNPDLKRLDRPAISFQGKGDRYGKTDNQTKSDRISHAAIGQKRSRILHQRPGKSAGAPQPGGRGEGVLAHARRRTGAGDTDRT